MQKYIKNFRFWIYNTDNIEWWNGTKEQKRGFRLTLLGNVGASLLRNMLACRGQDINRAGKGMIRAGYESVN